MAHKSGLSATAAPAFGLYLAPCPAPGQPRAAAALEQAGGLPSTECACALCVCRRPVLQGVAGAAAGQSVRLHLVGRSSGHEQQPVRGWVPWQVHRSRSCSWSVCDELAGRGGGHLSSASTAEALMSAVDSCVSVCAASSAAPSMASCRRRCCCAELTSTAGRGHGTGVCSTSL